MKKSVKKKYSDIKPDGQEYAALVSEFEKGEMSDYSFKSNAQAMGKNAKKLRRNKIIKTVLSIIGAILVLYFGYFIIALIKGVNARTGPTEVYIETTVEATTVPASRPATTVPRTTEPEKREEEEPTQQQTPAQQENYADEGQQ